MADINDVYEAVTELKFNVMAGNERQARLADAMEKLTTAVTTLHAATEFLAKRNGSPIVTKPQLELTPRMIVMGIAGALLVGMSMQGGGEILQVLMHILTGGK